jgi:5-methylcytosine-specific restriction endonuclease McrA
LPPPAVKTVRDLLYWQYAKIIANSAGEGKSNYGFIMNRFKKLQSGEIQWSSSIREYVKEHEDTSLCVYCGNREELTVEHMLPRSRGGPDVPENAVWVCAHCNSSKGSKRLYEWYGLEKRNELPRIAEGKYLKLLYALHEGGGTLSAKPSELCSSCDLGPKCPVEGKLSVYCLEGRFTRK